MRTFWTAAMLAMGLAGAAQAQYAPGPYGPRGYGQGYGYGAPYGPSGDPRARIDFLQQRIDRGVRDGSLDPHEARGAARELAHIRARARDLYARDRGQLSGGHQADLERRLDDLGRRLRWDRRAY